MMARVAVVDALAPDAGPFDVEVDASDCRLGELRALVLSLPLPSAEAALADGNGEALHVCHDGRLLVDDERTLESLGILAAPVVVVMAPTHRSPPPPPAAPPASPPASSAAIADDATEPEPPDAGPPPDAVCRICFGSAFENGLGRLISPCMCAGTMRYVHVDCLNDWRGHSANPRSFYECDQCHYQYNVARTKWAAILESARVVHGFAALLLVLATLAAALVLAPLGAARRFFLLVRVDPCTPRDLPWPLPWPLPRPPLTSRGLSRGLSRDLP